MRALRIALLLGAIASTALAQYPITPVRFTNVRLNDNFWSKRLEVNRLVTIPYAFRQCDLTGRLKNFDLAASVMNHVVDSAQFCGRYGFDDSDVYKIIEGAAYSMHTHPDAELDRYVDSLIRRIARAQEPDGYLYTMRTMNPPRSWAKERWVNDRTRGSHELYNLGHLYEAAAAHYQATGKRQLLDIALKSADLLCATFGPGKMRTVPGHQVTEIGLAKLYVVTGKRKYLDLAKFFLDERGNPPGETYNQDQLPVLQQTEAVGHAVRAGYMYSGMADVAALTGDPAYVAAIDRLWQDVVSHKLYLTGGVGAVGSIEGFGPAYDLPNLDAYCETCASIANVFWNERMFLLHGDARYIDVLERSLYNAFLSGVALEGNRFFYPNPLESTKGAPRSPWFTCACCPSNIVRFVPSIPGYIYAMHGDSVYVNLFIGGEMTTKMPHGALQMIQEGNYPWSGDVRLTVRPEKKMPMTLLVRIPGWAQGKPLASDLYTYAEKSGTPVRLAVNGRPVEISMYNGYAAITRTWSNGDRVELSLPMEVHRTLANDKVEVDCGRVAFERGPLVYCLEGVDNEDGRVLDLVIPDSVRLTSMFHPGILGGLQVIQGQAIPTHRLTDGRVEAGVIRPFTAIPYYAWAHRGLSPMTVWPAREVAAARPVPAQSLLLGARMTISGGEGEEALTDQLLPRHSADLGVPSFVPWGRPGEPRWVQFNFGKPVSITRIHVYWMDDKNETRLPRSWRLLVHDGGAWFPVAGASRFTVDADRMNSVTFSPSDTDGIRIEIEPQEKKQVGMYEVVVE